MVRTSFLIGSDESFINSFCCSSLNSINYSSFFQNFDQMEKSELGISESNHFILMCYDENMFNFLVLSHLLQTVFLSPKILVRYFSWHLQFIGWWINHGFLLFVVMYFSQLLKFHSSCLLLWSQFSWNIFSLLD